MDCASQHASRPPFLSLPQSIRQRIYIEAGLRINHAVDLNKRLEKPPRGRFESYYGCTHALLLTCRLVYAEASMLVYSGKKKFLLHRNTKSLKALTNLMETSLASLTHLTVHLNVSSCESDGKGNSDCCVTHGYTMTYTCTKEYCRKHDQPLGKTSRDRAILLEW